MAIYSHFIATHRETGFEFRKPFLAGHLATLYGGQWDPVHGDDPVTVAQDTAQQLIDGWDNYYWTYTLEKAE